MHAPLRPLLFAGALLSAVLPATAVAAPVSEKAPAAANGAVNVTAVSTELEIVGTSRKEVAVTGDLPDGFKLTVTRKNKSTEIQVQPPKGGRR